jgi:DNA-binding CsgD family transcriptional regulator
MRVRWTATTRDKAEVGAILGINENTIFFDVREMA